MPRSLDNVNMCRMAINSLLLNRTNLGFFSVKKYAEQITARILLLKASRYRLSQFMSDIPIRNAIDDLQAPLFFF